MTSGQYPQYSNWTPVPNPSHQQNQTQWNQADKRVAGGPLPEEPELIMVTEDLEKRSFRQRWFGGLPFTLRALAFLSTCIQFINIGWFVWVSNKYQVKDGYGTIQEGDCAATKSLNTWLHLAINILSTGLILSSTSFMQLVNSPSRKEVDSAHAHGKWLTVGILSLGNLRRLSARKNILCLILALSSAPFHLLYNSVIFSSLSATDYYWAVTTEGFLTGDSFDLPHSNGGLDSSFSPISQDINGSFISDFQFVYRAGPSTPEEWVEAYQELQQNVSTYDRLDRQACLKEYSNRLIEDRRNLILVSSEKNSSNSVLSFNSVNIDNEGSLDALYWICSNDPGSDRSTCDPSPYLQDPSSWKVYGHPIEYCMSERATAACAVKFSFGIAISVITCNAIKVIAMVYIIFKIDIHSTLTCHGDVIASFLSREDMTTVNMSMAGRRNFKSRQWFSSYRWGSAATRKRWIFSILTMITALLLVLFLLVVAALPDIKTKGFSTSVKGLWDLGFGAVNPRIVASSENFGTPATLALLANLPQLILDCIYLVYNALFRIMFAAQDYSSLAFKGQHLMVSNPTGKQRGTWFLGFPFPWAFPLLILQTLLHWFVSRSFFVVQVTVYDQKGRLDTTPFANILNCGYSPIAMVFAVIAAAIMMLLTIGLGLRKFKEGCPPVVGGGSAAISAACHSPPGERMDGMAWRQLMWHWRATGNGFVHGWIGPV